MKYAISGLAMMVVLLACQTSPAARHTETVELFIKGSDIETPENSATHALRDLLEARLAARQDIRIAAAGEGTLTFIIPDLVKIDKSAQPQTVTYVAQISWKGESSSKTVTGSCPSTNLSACADRMVSQLAAFSQ